MNLTIIRRTWTGYRGHARDVESHGERGCMTL